MKTRKIISVAFITLFILSMALMTGCGGDKTPSYVGKWEAVAIKADDIELDAKKNGFDMTLDLKEDGKGEATFSGEKADMEYKVDGEKIEITVQEETMSGTLSETELILNDDALGGTIVFNKAKAE